MISKQWMKLAAVAVIALLIPRSTQKSKQSKSDKLALPVEKDATEAQHKMSNAEK